MLTLAATGAGSAPSSLGAGGGRSARGGKSTVPTTVSGGLRSARVWRACADACGAHAAPRKEVRSAWWHCA